MITTKFFEHNLANRVTGAELLRAALGEELTLAPAAERAVVNASASIDPSALDAGMQRELRLEFAVPSGQHVYGLPVPDGMVHAHAVLDDGPWTLHRIDGPPTSAHTLAGTGDELQIYESSVVLRAVVSHNGSDLGDTTISGELRWQACDDDQCFLPQRQRFELPVATRGARWMNWKDDGGENVAEHFARMAARHEQPD